MELEVLSEARRRSRRMQSPTRFRLAAVQHIPAKPAMIRLLQPSGFPLHLDEADRKPLGTRQPELPVSR